MNTTQEPAVFSGLKVIDFASYIAGPAATTILSDFGADVIKLEPPNTGDPYRNFYKSPANPSLKENYAWQVTNRNKRSIVLDLKKSQSKEILTRLIRWADVIVINYPPHVRKKLGLEYSDISPLNPHIIYADITGYGQAGPEANLPGFDLTAYWARSGLMQFTREASSPPAIPVPGIGDHATAVSLYAAIVTGLYRRNQTGKGSNVSTSLIANGAWATAAWLQAGLFGAKFSGEIHRNNPPSALAGSSYQTSDNRWILLAFVEENKNWPVFAQAIGRSDLLEDERFSNDKNRNNNTSELVLELDKVFKTQPLQHWKNILDTQRLPYGIVQIPEEIIKDPQLWENKIIVPIEGENSSEKYTVDSPFTIGEYQKNKPQMAPDLGEHTEEILKEVGFTTEDIHALKNENIVQ